MSGSDPAPVRKAARCPICGRPADRLIRPFCSKRCADVDLARWLKGGYAIPAQEEPEGGDETPERRPHDES